MPKTWKRLLRANGRSVETIDSGLHTYKRSFRPPYRGERHFTHFLVRPSRAND